MGATHLWYYQGSKRWDKVIESDVQNQIFKFV
jgi:hypothetical protein